MGNNRKQLIKAFLFIGGRLVSPDQGKADYALKASASHGKNLNAGQRIEKFCWAGI